MTACSLRGRVAVVGIGETEYFRHGQSPDAEFKLALKAILAACKDAGLDPREIDGFASYGDDRSDASRLAAALGIRQLRAATMHLARMSCTRSLSSTSSSSTSSAMSGSPKYSEA